MPIAKHIHAYCKTHTCLLQNTYMPIAKHIPCLLQNTYHAYYKTHTMPIAKHIPCLLQNTYHAYCKTHTMPIAKHIPCLLQNTYMPIAKHILIVTIYCNCVLHTMQYGNYIQLEN